MVRLTPPYFFDEFLLPISRCTLSERELELGLTVKDLNWLHNLYYATDAARQDALRDHPMCVEKLLISVEGQAAIPLAGAFLISPTPDEGKALLYTPYGGIQVSGSHAALLLEVGEQLADPVQRVDLMRFLSIAQRNALPVGTAMTLSTATIEGIVMADQEQTLQACQQANVHAMLLQLQKIPALPDMLNTLLGIMARPYFPGLDQRDTRVNCFVQNPDESNRRWVDSLPLSEALLRFYLKHAWPSAQTREFFNPKHVTSAFTHAQLDQDQQYWETLIEQTSSTLSKLLDSLLQTYWNEDIGSGTSRLDLFAQVIADKFRVDVLFKRQEQIISADESHTLQAAFISDQSARSAYATKLSVEKVRIHAPYQHYVELASTLMIHETCAYLYTQSRGLQILKDRNDLKDTLLSMLKTAGHKDELLNFLSLDERNTFTGLDQINVAFRPITGSVFTGMVQDIALKQTNNMHYALELHRNSDGQVDLAALLDCALDVRIMLDDRLAPLETNGRWTVHPVTRGNDVKAELAKRHLRRLEAAEAELAIERQKHPTLRGMAALALDAELQLQRLDLKADEVYINTYDTPAQEREERPPVSSLGMVEHFIERLSLEARPIPKSDKVWFYKKIEPHVALKLPALTLSTFNRVIERTMKVFANTEMRELPRLFLGNASDKHARSMLLGLSSEAELRRLDKTINARSYAVLDTVLQPDSLLRLTRHGLNGFLPDAYSLTLGIGTLAEPKPLANTFVLTERGGIDPERSGQVVLWTPRNGHEVFTSIQTLREELTQRLEHPIKRLSLLENLPISLHIPHQVYRLGPLQRIDDNVLNNRLETYNAYVMDKVDHLLSMKLPARALQDRLDTVLEQPAPTNLARTIAVARMMSNQQALPVWLAMASPEDQAHQAELLEQYHNSAPDEQDFLHDITPIRKHAFTALQALLKKRFPDQTLNPDDIVIPMHQALDIHDYSLTDFALRHWPELNAEIISPRSCTATPLPATLDGTAVIQMVRQLDLKTVYQNLLRSHLDTQTDAARKRRRLFCRQLPWQLLQYAHEQRLQERLSAAAQSLVQQVFNMPDAVAREALDGTTAMMRPLELIATEGASTVKVVGMYLISAKTTGIGPVVLYAPYSENHVLKEYATEQALLDELNRPGVLQDCVIQHLEAAHQATYSRLLQNNQQSPSDIRLGSSAIGGNLLHYLFDETKQVLHKMLACQFEKGAKVLWDKVTQFFSEKIPTAVQFMAGKLSYPLTVWRAYTLFKRSAEELQLHQWKAALKDFILGVAEMAALRGALEGTEKPLPLETAMPQAELPDESLPTATSLATLDITASARTQLQPFEDHEIALKDLEKSNLTHTYKDNKTLKNYVPVEGKVYSVKKTAEHWRLANDEHNGPHVGRNAQGHWVLDLNHQDTRFGAIQSLMRERYEHRLGINIEATGIRAIGALAQWKAQVIKEALNMATHYALTCKRNIALFSVLRNPTSRVGLFLGEMFSVVSLPPAQVQKIKNIVDEILGELSDHSLTGPDSMRFVIGSSRLNPESSFAFTRRGDIKNRLYLVTRFFHPDLGIYYNHLNAPFDAPSHARASTLIHELTHSKLDTEDIAYLNSMLPFSELISPAQPRGKALRDELEAQRSTALSTQTPSARLFKIQVSKGVWKDFGNDTKTSDIKRKVFSTTGAKNLDDARQVFMTDPDKRIDTILANADSVTYLITHLGRLLDPGA